ncbi:MAG: tRNA (N6-isopentenyl adenosine(37)-C2)-methylthiotransferase MiaB [Candidatus Zixiibacteriota bacterium]
MKSVYIETYGCQMNEYDTEIVKSILQENDYSIAEAPESASIILLNTCSVRENAHQRVLNRIETLKHLKKKNNGLVLGVIGCMAQNLKSELLEEGIGVDIIAGPDTYRRLPDLISRFEETGHKDFELKHSREETYSDVFPVHDEGANAWIAVMRGCDNVCTFCVVPATRGRERSRDPKSVVDEARRLADEGFKQVTLLGQNVNSYKYDGCDFADLIEMVGEVDGIRRIRFTSPHPKDFPPKLIQVVSDNPKACKHIHLPLQAGSDRILEMMNRTYTRQHFLDLVDIITRIIPDVALTTDIIVGFPTETEEEFLETLEVVEEVGFDSAFMFKYSERKDTVAERKFPDDVSEEDKTSRITRLVDVQRRISLTINAVELGKTFEILVEGRAKKPDQLLGRNDGNKIVVFPDNGAKPGDFVNVRVYEATPNTLIGEVVQ